MKTTTAVNHPNESAIRRGPRSSAATMPVEAEPLKLRKRIGSTLYTANVYFCNSSSETLADKILRLAKNDGLDFQTGQARKSLRTGQTQERRETQHD
jgi:hypothetical protein